VLLSAGIVLKRVFSPEHGFGALQDGPVQDRAEAASGIEVTSLYGQRRRPDPESLEGIDLMLVDLQDVGARFYTYATTLGYCMEACSQAQIPLWVLDRPNPITGLYPEGPLLDPGLESFVGYARLPVRHGLTLGELARFFRRARGMDLDLQVIPMAGWRRYLWFDETGLPWRNPSPNMRTLTAALLYPGLCLLERTNVSVGRGTPAPFERIGAPWIGGRELAGKMNQLDLPGVSFLPVEFSPEAGPCQGQRCEGIHCLVSDREAFRPVRMGFEILSALAGLWPEALDLSGVDEIVGLRGSEGLIRGRAPADLEKDWIPGLLGLLDDRMEAFLY
jgi:uncharacterized protein YbbC (DUF1343 family)